MLITNRKQIVEHPFDLAKLKETAIHFTNHAQTTLGKQCKFPVHYPTGAKFPVIENDQNLTFAELEKIAPEKIVFRAFDSENITLPKTQTKSIKHELEEKDRLDIAKKLADDRLAFELLEQEKKEEMAKFKEKLDNLDAAISHGAETYRNGFEIRDVEVTIELDFKNSAKIYKDKVTGKFLDSVDMEESDRQLIVDFDALKGEPTEFQHSRIEEYLNQCKTEGVEMKFKKDSDTSDFPNLLMVNQEPFAYESSKDRDADYTLARKRFPKLQKVD